MPHLALTILREEHAALYAVLRSIELLLDQQRHTGRAPDFVALRTMLFYIDEFPEQRHHRTESQLLFPKLRARTPQARHLLDKLDDDHACGERAVRGLQRALLAYEMLGEARREAFESATRQYVTFYLEHMREEEDQILPLAEQVLTPEDWAELDAAFARHHDPLLGHAPDSAYKALFRRIVDIVPAPIGLGAAA